MFPVALGILIELSCHWYVLPVPKGAVNNNDPVQLLTLPKGLIAIVVARVVRLELAVQPVAVFVTAT